MLMSHRVRPCEERGVVDGVHDLLDVGVVFLIPVILIGFSLREFGVGLVMGGYVGCDCRGDRLEELRESVAEVSYCA